MKMKLFFIILFTAVSVFAYADEKLNKIIKVMVDNIKIDNSKSVTIPGLKGALRIYIESGNYNRNSNEYVVISYNEKQVTFHAGNNFLITQDDNLVFGKYVSMVYAKKYVQSNKEHLTIKYNGFIYEYSSKNVSISVDDQEYTAEEILYDKDDKIITIYEKSKPKERVNLGI